MREMWHDIHQDGIVEIEARNSPRQVTLSVRLQHIFQLMLNRLYYKQSNSGILHKEIAGVKLYKLHFLFLGF